MNLRSSTTPSAISPKRVTKKTTAATADEDDKSPTPQVPIATRLVQSCGWPTEAALPDARRGKRG